MEVIIEARQNVANDGKSCINWNKSYYKNGSGNAGLDAWSNAKVKSEKGIGNHNYCRNPDNHSSLWCPTGPNQEDWKNCSPIESGQRKLRSITLIFLMCVDLNNRYCNERTGICGNGQSFRSESSGRYDFKAKFTKILE